MTRNVETVTPDLMMEEVAAMMTMYGVKHLPVVDDDYVGMVFLRPISPNTFREWAGAGRSLAAFIGGAAVHRPRHPPRSTRGSRTAPAGPVLA